MASIKPIEGKSVHKIQSGQVILDLCSVVKELLENSLDAGATSIEIRFKGHGLDGVEVQDNGSGISKEDYGSVALKHYTSKLSNYDDLTSLQSFGFRGEALSSLCALSNVHIVTARQDEAPKGSRLDFESSGGLKSTQTVACQRGTTVAVEAVFKSLPVRRQELEKNIKREYGKVLSLLQAYACVSTEVKISVSNVLAKGKKTVAFATQANRATRDNIANVFGAKTLLALLPLDLDLELERSIRVSVAQGNQSNQQVRVVGHVSRPVFGEGRQTPDRQMFFVNGRPAALPQVAKVFNEVYKSYNLAQSPFIFANVVLDTSAYDVNVSPDKRTIMLHDQSVLLESIKTSLTELFDKQQQTVPQSQQLGSKPPLFNRLSANRESSVGRATPESGDYSNNGTPGLETDCPAGYTPGDALDSHVSSLIHGQRTRGRNDPATTGRLEDTIQGSLIEKQRREERPSEDENLGDEPNERNRQELATPRVPTQPAHIPVLDFNKRLTEFQARRGTNQGHSPPSNHDHEEDIFATKSVPKPVPGSVPNAFDRMRPMRRPEQTATITIGSKTITSTIGTPSRSILVSSKKPLRQIIHHRSKTPERVRFGSALKLFTASRVEDDGSQEDDGSVEDGLGVQSNPAVSDESDSDRGEESPEPAKTDQCIIPLSEEGGDTDELLDQEDSGHERKQDSGPDGSDDKYLDDITKKAREDAKVDRLIREAEEQAAVPSQDHLKRAHVLLRGGGRKESTTQLMQTIDTSTQWIRERALQLHSSMRDPSTSIADADTATPADAVSAEERLSLTVSKTDFDRMRIIGQFNLGFILAVRPAHLPTDHPSTTHRPSADELFIIDQHASDEKYNFEMLQASTVVQHQRLVHPHPLDLTAIEEEIILDEQAALLKNGFVVSIDDSGALPVGRRARLLSLPMSREVTFSVRDLEELIALLAESPSSGSTSSKTVSTDVHVTADGGGGGGSARRTRDDVPRPSKIRKMFAMRACRSSVMIGKTLTAGQMGKLVRQMGGMERPWNCPHGRPTMRHVSGLEGWRGRREGDGLRGLGFDLDEGQGEEEEEEWGGGGEGDKGVDWGLWLRGRDGGRERMDLDLEGGGDGDGNGENDGDGDGDADADEDE